MRRLKSIILGWIYHVSASLPPQLSVWLVNRSLPWGRPVLDYLEFHLADHCNLNCAGCTHFSPFADHRFADLEGTRRDFARLKEIFSNIRHIRIMGGEPLLNPECAQFVKLVRDAFPRSKVRLVTNGIKLLDETDENVKRALDAMREAKVGLDWTCYPPVAGRRDVICRRCSDAGVDLRITENGEFMVRMRPKGDSDPKATFRWCRRNFYCPVLDSGRIYICAQVCYARYYNRAAGTALASDDGVDIYTASAREVLRYLMRPSKACAFCDAGARHFAWKGNAKPEDWLR
jgi:hypothetical protein